MESRSTMGVETLGGQFANRPVSRPDWYYALDGEQKGPVSAEDFERLVEAGVVTPATRVWSEGMADWQTLAKVRPTNPAAAPLPSPVSSTGASDSSRCGLCGVAVTAEDSVRLDGRVVCAACKQRAAQMLKEGGKPVNPQAEQIRREHLKHEASIRLVGTLYVLIASLLSVSGFLNPIVLLVRIAAGAANTAGGEVGSAAAFAAISLGLAAMLFGIGVGLRRLNPSARNIAGALSRVGLIGFPIGTLINGYILWLFRSEKGRRVFSEEYRQIRAETPHIRCRTPVWFWVLVALLVGGVALSVAYFALVR